MALEDLELNTQVTVHFYYVFLSFRSLTNEFVGVNTRWLIQTNSPVMGRFKVIHTNSYEIGQLVKYCREIGLDKPSPHL